MKVQKDSILNIYIKNINFCNIINVFTLTFEQFNDLILLGKQNLADPKLLTNNVFLIIDIYYVLIMSCLFIYIYTNNTGLFV